MAPRIYPDHRIPDRLRVGFWVLEFIELILSIIILGITASAASGMTSDLQFPSIPGKLTYNIFLATLTTLSLLILFILDVFPHSPTSTWRRWHSYEAGHPWPRFSLNVLFIALWAGAIGSSFYTCSDLCGAAGGQFSFIKFATLCCNCAAGDVFSGSCFVEKSDTFEQRTGRYEATQGLDILLLVMFIVSAIIMAAQYWWREPEAAGMASGGMVEERQQEQQEVGTQDSQDPRANLY